MRKHLVLFKIIFINLVNAQYTITSSSNPVAGDVENRLTVSNINLSAPISGTNILWDYSNISLQNNLIFSDFYGLASATPNGTLFTNANTASFRVGNGYDYYNFSNNSREWVGSKYTSSTYIASDGRVSMTLPFMYGSAYNDTYVYTAPSGTHVGVENGLGSGTGTLAVPGYTLNNVLLITYSRNETIISSSTSTRVVDYFMFYSMYSKFPLLAIGTFTDISSAGTSTSISGFINADLNISVNIMKPICENTLFEVYPNPSSNTLNLKLVEGKSIESFSIFDELGREVLEQKDNTTKINIEGLNKGIYQLMITSEGKSYTTKFIKE